MNTEFQLSCESTVDLPYAYVSGRNMTVLFYSYMIDGKEYVDDMGRDESARDEFYAAIKAGKKPTTSQINTYRYTEYFRDLLEKGNVLHIAFGSGMTPSVHHAMEAAKQLRAEFPDRKIIVVDSTCSSSGYGLLVDTAADLRDAGKSMEEIEAWVIANRKQVHHNFFVTDLTMLRRGGRVSGPAAAIATVLGICPILCLNETGHIIAHSKVRGKKAAIDATVRAMVDHAAGGKEYNGKCFISHANALEDAMTTKAKIENEFPALAGKVQIFEIGTIIASHCGPGTVALFFMGDERV